MTTKQRFNLVNELVKDCNKVCSDTLSAKLYDGGTIEITTDYSLSGVFVKDFAALCTAFGWCFGIYTDSSTGRPYIHLC